MNILSIVLLWIISWILIIILSAVSTKLYGADVKKYGEEHIGILPYPKCQQEMLLDGNNLFTTGLIYTIVFAFCSFFKNNIANYVCLIVGIVFCIPSIFSIFKTMIPQVFIVKNKYITLMTISSAICAFVPFLIAINIIL